MKKKIPILILMTAIFVSCNTEQKKVDELEKKIEKQSEELKSMQEEALNKEIEQKNKEIEELKIKANAKVNQQPVKNGSGANYYAQGFGKYPIASARILTYDDVNHLSKDELSIMRNEIFARHGFIFKTQKMIDYFSKQNWYSPMYNDVNGSLSPIEQKNIQFIKSFE
jgi:hypothetical protein